jgi:DNA repair protein RecO (recombination protein O)
MKPRRFSSEAIVLKRKSYSEADRILTVLSKDYGKLSLMARGVRKPKSRKRGALEVFSRLKFSASRGKSLDLVTEAEIIDSFNSIRDDLKKVSVAYFFVETVDKLTREDEKHVDVYVLLLRNLKELQDSESLRRQREQFIYEILVLLGYWPKGKELDNHDQALENVTERNIASVRVGKKVLA